MPLLPKDLLQVTGGPKIVNFGTISVFTTVHRSFNMANDLLTNGKRLTLMLIHITRARRRRRRMIRMMMITITTTTIIII
jgi:hypothetical protein